MLAVARVHAGLGVENRLGLLHARDQREHPFFQAGHELVIEGAVLMIGDGVEGIALFQQHSFDHFVLGVRMINRRETAGHHLEVDRIDRANRPRANLHHLQILVGRALEKPECPGSFHISQ